MPHGPVQFRAFSVHAGPAEPWRLGRGSLQTVDERVPVGHFNPSLIPGVPANPSKPSQRGYPPVNDRSYSDSHDRVDRFAGDPLHRQASMIVFAGSANPRLAREIVERLNMPVGKAVVDRFSDGESWSS